MVDAITQPLVSVVIPTYNREQIVLSAIESVLAQYFQNFEIIIVDNGSTDATREAVGSIKDSRIRYFFQPGSGSPASPRNVGIARAHGEWIAFLDSDDTWRREKLGEVFQIIRLARYDLISHWQQIDDVQGQSSRLIGDLSRTPLTYKRLLLEGNCLATSSLVLRRSFIEKWGLKFNESKKYIAVEDYDLWLNMLAVGAAPFTIRKVLGANRSSADHLGSDALIYQNLTYVLRRHTWEIQDFSQDKAAVEKRLIVTVMLSQAFGAFRRKDYIGAMSLFRRVLRISPLEILRYMWLRVRGRCLRRRSFIE